MEPKGVVDDKVLEELIGDLIGRGSARLVYKMKNDSCCVIKAGCTSPYASNKTEWTIWQEISESKFASLFGECFAISTSHHYLVMEYLESLAETDTAPIPPTPVWLTDRKPSAFGKASNGAIKVRDYSQVRDCIDRANAPTQPWPSEAETLSMADIMAGLNKIQDDG